MRIAIVSTDVRFPDGTSSARRVAAFAQGLAAQGHNVRIILAVQLRARRGYSLVNGIPVQTLSTWRPTKTRVEEAWFLLKWRTQFLLWMFGLITHHEYDWILPYNLTVFGAAIAVFGQLGGMSVGSIVCDIRDTQASGFRLKLLKLGDYLSFKWSNLNIVITRFLREAARHSGPAVPVVIVPPLVDTHTFVADADGGARFRREYTIPVGPLVGYFGHLFFNQGVASLMAAIKKVNDQGVRLDLLLCVAALKGMRCDDVEAIAARFGIGQFTHFAGYLPTDKMLAALSACDILAIPRIPHPTNDAGSPTKLAEYFSMGKPVVAARVGDIPLYCDAVDTLLLTEPGNVDSLATALMTLVREPTLRESLGAAARTYAEAHFEFRVAMKSVSQALMHPSSRLGEVLPFRNKSLAQSESGGGPSGANVQ